MNSRRSALLTLKTVDAISLPSPFLSNLEMIPSTRPGANPPTPRVRMAVNSSAVIEPLQAFEKFDKDGSDHRTVTGWQEGELRAVGCASNRSQIHG